MKPRHLLSILTGILIGTSYIPFPPWAVFFCFVPLMLAWLDENANYKQVFWTGWLSQFILTLIGFNWVSYTVHEFGHMPWPVAILVLAAFCAIANLQIPLAGMLWLYTAKRLRLSTVGKIASMAALLAIGYRAFPMIFDWHLGYTWLWAGFPAYQLADIIGFIGFNDLTLAFNALLAYAWKTKNWRWAAVAPSLFLALNLAGHYRAAPPPPDAVARFLVIQASISNQEKLEAEAGSHFREEVIGRFARLTRAGLEKHPNADYVVWPETAFPELIYERELSHGYPLMLKNLVMEKGVKMITGGYSRQESTGRVTNSFFVLDGQGRWLNEPYHKTVLLAFGEYMPFGDYLPKLREWIPETADFGRGPGPTVLEADGLKIGAQICYEGLFDWFTRDLANRGAQVVVNVTNDSWYGKWAQPFQHGYMTLARAIEVRRPLVRSTNTGMTVAILADGTILEPSPLHEEWFHLYEIPYARTPVATLFMGWTYWLMPSLLALAIVLSAIFGRVRNEE